MLVLHMAIIHMHAIIHIMAMLCNMYFCKQEVGVYKK